MSAFLDSSVLIAALGPDEDHHEESLAILMQGGHSIYLHALLETFATLTGGKLGIKVDADLAARMLHETVMPKVRVVDFNATELLAALALARKHGVRGGAVYDFMHLVAARKAGASAIHTLNVDDFQSLARTGDPVILHP